MKRKVKIHNRLIIEEGSVLEPRKSTIRITLNYVIGGSLWILLSDQILDRFITDPSRLALFNTIKGWIFVLVTSSLLYALLSYALGEAKKHEQCQLESYKKLKQIHLQLEESEQKLRQQLADNQTYQERLHYLAYFDPLTKLPNRLSLDENLDTVSQQQEVALLFIDLDNFKDINDFRSHQIGDHLLQMVGQRLGKVVDKRGTVYRFGGDEFIVLMPKATELEARGLAKEIIMSFREAFTYKDTQVHLTPSVGIACGDAGSLTRTDLIRFADLAMHDSKKRGGNCFTLYHTELSDQSLDRVLIEGQLRNALEQNLLTLYYQPEVRLQSGEISGFEALLRWEPQDAISGNVEQVIKVAEATGLIVPVGEWILKEACLFLKKVHEAGYDQTCISVNVSVVQFSRFNFPQRVQKILQEVDLNPSFLRLEITESVLMESYDLIDQQLETLRSLGVKMALDDFGKGYSSLSYLKILPLDTLKIDKSFIDYIPVNPKDAFLATQIIAIGKNLGLQVVAEGVETEEQLEYLKNHNCDRFQGYYYSPPVPAHKALGLLA